MYNLFCLSSYLAFRYVANDGFSWKSGITPILPKIEKKDRIGVRTADDVIARLSNQVKADLQTGILLSSGIDSAILASFLPEGTKAYTIKFIADGAVDESEGASVYAKQLKLRHKIIDVTWQDYLKYADVLMVNKKSPLHAIEVALYKAALAAKKDGLETLVVGNGADSTFGGMDKLLSRDWTFNEFVKRYTFIEPSSVLKKYENVDYVYETFRNNGGIDVVGFLKHIHGLGIIQAFNNAIENAGCKVVAPFESMYLDAELDFLRIRGGQSKYILREVFQRRFHNFSVPEKIPFARPMDQWLQNWKGPERSEFVHAIDMKSFTGDQKWLLYCLERFLNLLGNME